MRADRSEGMKGISGSLIDRMRRRSGVDAAGAVGHWCWARSSGFFGRTGTSGAFGPLPQLLL